MKVVKVEEIETKSGIKSVKVVVADDTACANGFFVGDNAKIIKEGAVVAIRNGSIRFIKNHISLEVDMFGRVTPETQAIKENLTNNISEK